MYPKVKVRQDLYEDDEFEGDDVQDLDLKSLSSHDSPRSVKDLKSVSVPSIVEVPKCYVPQPYVPIPRAPVTEIFEDSTLTSDSSGSARLEKDGSTDDNKVNIRASSIPRPRAVISSPDNDTLIRNRNMTRDGRLPASKNGTVLNRHAHSKVKSHEVADVPPDTRKSKEPGSKDKVDPVEKKRVPKVSTKSEKAPKAWKF